MKTHFLVIKGRNVKYNKHFRCGRFEVTKIYDHIERQIGDCTRIIVSENNTKKITGVQKCHVTKTTK